MDANQKKITGIIIATVFSVCALATCLVAAWSYSTYQEEVSAVLGIAPSQKVAKLLPQETQFYAALTPNIQALAASGTLMALFADDVNLGELLDGGQAPLWASDITFQDDVMPWLGPEMVFAMPNFAEVANAPPGRSVPPQVIMAAQTIDKTASDAFIDKILTEPEQGPGEPFITETYKDVTLHRQPQPDNGAYEELIVTTFGDLVVISSSRALVEDMIDQALGESTVAPLTDNASYNRILAELPGDAIGTMYMTGDEFSETFMADNPLGMPLSQGQNMDTFEAFGFAALLHPDGVEVQGLVTYNPEQLSEEVRASFQRPPTDNQIINQLPAEALFVYSANNLNDLWLQTRGNLEDDPSYGENMRQMETELGFNMEQDLFGWMTGEYAMVMVEDPTAEPPLGGYLLIGSENIEEARPRMEKVTTPFEESMGMFLRQQTVSGVELTTAVDIMGGGQFLGGYGFYEDYFLVVYGEAGMEALVNASDNSLAQTAHFQTIRDYLPTPNRGYIYLNMEQALPLLTEQMSPAERQQFEQEVRPYVEPIQAIGVTTSSEGFERGVSRGSMFFLISEAE